MFVWGWQWVRGEMGARQPLALPQAGEGEASPAMPRSARLKWRAGGAIQMCAVILPHLRASSTHPEAFTCATPKADLLQNQESLGNNLLFPSEIRCARVRSRRKRRNTSQIACADSAPVSQSQLVHFIRGHSLGWLCPQQPELFLFPCVRWLKAQTAFTIPPW